MSAVVFWALVVLCLVVAPIWGAVLTFLEDYAGGLVDIFAGLFFGVVVGGISLVIIGGLGAWATDHNETKTFDMKSIGTATAIHGSFFLGSGQIDQEPVYYWYGKNPDGSYTLANVLAGDSRVIETSAKPHAVCTRNVVSWPPIFYGPYDDANDGTRCTFYVPPNSIASTVDLSLPGAKS